MATRQNRMSLICELGWHRPRRVARWNNGYYFTRCSRCGRDLVRTAYGRWHEPHGYRVVWQAQAPAGAVSARLISEEANAAAGTAELPIQEVLRHLQNGDTETGPSLGDTPVEPIEDGDETLREATGEVGATDDGAGQALNDLPARRPRSGIPDFMDDANVGPAHPYPPRRPGADRDRAVGMSDREREPGPFNRLQTRFAGLFREGREADEESRPGLLKRSRARFATLLERYRSGAPSAIGGSEPRSTTGVPVRRLRDLQPALIMAIPIALLMIVVLGLALWNRVGAPAVEASAQHAVPLRSEGGQSAFVTASVLNCRTAPAREADAVAVLMRGDPVRLLARDGEWVSLADAGGQCWALARYFSVQAPL